MLSVRCATSARCDGSRVFRSVGAFAEADPTAKDATSAAGRAAAGAEGIGNDNSEPGGVENATKTKGREGAEQHAFQAEVSRLLDIIINSLYSNKDIFMREVVSNSADALDKIRYLSLTEGQEVLGEGDLTNLDIRIWLDPERQTLNLRDKGIGMTKADLRENLGTIAKSGTSAFIDQVAKTGDVSLIGQFGVGFYSVYLVSDYVEVVTKNNEDKQYIWESAADGNFAISEDTENEPLGRGTLVRMHLREDSLEYNSQERIKYVSHPFSLVWMSPCIIVASCDVCVCAQGLGAKV